MSEIYAKSIQAYYEKSRMERCWQCFDKVRKLFSGVLTLGMMDRIKKK